MRYDTERLLVYVVFYRTGAGRICVSSEFDSYVEAETFKQLLCAYMKAPALLFVEAVNA